MALLLAVACLIGGFFGDTAPACYGVSAAPSPVRSEPAAWPTLLPGEWFASENGAGVKDGGLVLGGATVLFIHHKQSSRTPWNVTWIAPAAGHVKAADVSGGCGFYPSGRAYCRGYGVPATGAAIKTTVAIERVESGELRFAVGGLVELYLVRERSE